MSYVCCQFCAVLEYLSSTHIAGNFCLVINQHLKIFIFQKATPVDFEIFENYFHWKFPAIQYVYDMIVYVFTIVAIVFTIVAIVFRGSGGECSNWPCGLWL